MANVCALFFFAFFGYLSFLEISVNSQDKSVNDRHDAEVRLKLDLLKNYTIDVLPPHNATNPVVLILDLQIVSIKSLSWTDPRLQWKSSDYDGIDVIRLAAHKIWQPDVQLYNSADNKLTDVDAKVFSLVYPSGAVAWIPPVSINSLCMVDLKYYPYDQHKCIYKYGSWTHDGYHLDVALSDERKNNSALDLSDTFNEAGEWAIIDTSAEKSVVHYECCPEPYTDVSFSVTLQRRSPFYKVAIVCPLVATVFLILTSLWISPMVYHRMTLNILSFLILVIILMHLSTRLPAVGKDSPLIMTFCGVLLILLALLTTINFVYLAVLNSKKNEKIPEIISKLMHRRIMDILCITSVVQNKGSDSMDAHLAIPMNEDESGVSEPVANSTLNQWIMLFQLIDRMAFIFVLIIIIITMTACSV